MVLFYLRTIVKIIGRRVSTMFLFWVIPLVILVIAVQTSVTKGRHILASDNCSGNDCLYGSERNEINCVCCMSCKHMAYRLPNPLIKCPTELRHCGDCIPGYESKPTFGKYNNYDICVKSNAENLTTTPIILSKELRSKTSNESALLWVLPLVALVLIGVVVAGVFIYKKSSIRKRLGLQDQRIPLRDFSTSRNEDNANNGNVETEVNNSLKQPEENDVRYCHSSTPCFRPERSQSIPYITNNTLQQAVPIDPPERNPNSSFQTRSAITLNRSHPSAPSLSTVSNESSTDSIRNNFEFITPDSGHQSNYSSLGSGNYSQASTIPIDQLETHNHINLNACNQPIRNDGGFRLTGTFEGTVTSY